MNYSKKLTIGSAISGVMLGLGIWYLIQQNYVIGTIHIIAALLDYTAWCIAPQMYKKTICKIIDNEQIDDKELSSLRQSYKQKRDLLLSKYDRYKKLSLTDKIPYQKDLTKLEKELDDIERKIFARYTQLKKVKV